MQQIIDQFAEITTPSGKIITIAIKVVVEAGPVRRFRVGDPDIQYIDVLVGRTLDRLGFLQAHAPIGQVIAGPAVVTQVGDNLITQWHHLSEENLPSIAGPATTFPASYVIVQGLKPSNHFSGDVQATFVPSGSLADHHVRPWLLPPVYERIKANRAKFLPELRTAVALFVKFRGIDYEDEAADKKLDAYIRWVQNTLSLYEGYLMQLTTGDKGSYLYIAFGALLAHGDDAVRAITAALELRAMPPALNFITDVQIGISQGRMRVGDYGGGQRRTYGVLGTEANIAARLMTEAEPGQILVSKDVADSATKAYHFRYFDDLQVKGKQEPIVIFNITGRRDAPAQRPPTLVGREAALTQLNPVLAAVETGQGQILRLEGVAGVGKSHLATDFIRQARHRGFQIARGVCQTGKQAQAYKPWRQIFFTWFDLSEGPSTAAERTTWATSQISQIEATIEDINPDWLPLLPLLSDLLDLPIPDNETTSIFDPITRQGILIALVLEMIKTWANEQPSFILIEDAHLMDRASQYVTLALGKSLKKSSILLGLVHRSPGSQGNPLLSDFNQLIYHNHLNLHGRNEPVTLQRPQLSQPDQDRVPAETLIGRSKERLRLSERLQTLTQEGVGSIVIIEGEAGIGKSRLVQDLIEQSQAWGVTALIGQADTIERLTPYHAWRPLFRQLFNLDAYPNATTIARRMQVLSLLPTRPGLLRLLPLLNAILPLGLQENETIKQMSRQARATNTMNLLLQLLQAGVAQTPTLIILEDAHWSDSASWALTHLISQRLSSILLIIITRPMIAPLPTEYQQLLAMPTTHFLKLEALSPDEAVILARQRLGVRQLPEPVAHLVRTKAAGHPFFSEEIAYMLRDTGRIQIVGGTCFIASDKTALDTVALPDTVEDIITSRIDRLTSSQQLTLKVASIIGPTFAYELLHDIHPIEADKQHLTGHLTKLMEIDIISLETSQPDPTYTFKHIITRDVTYAHMLFEQRQELHQAIAEWFERKHAKNLPPYFPFLAYHWRQALNQQRPDPKLVMKAIYYLEQAGEQALSTYANKEAVRYFSDILRLDIRDQAHRVRQPIFTALRFHIPDHYVRNSRWERHLGEAYLGLGQLVESRHHLEQAVAHLGWPEPTRHLRYLLSLGRQILRQTTHRLWPSRFSTQTHDTQAALIEAARVYERLGEIYYWFNETLPATYAALRTLNFAERAGPSPDLARAYANMCLVAGFYFTTPAGRSL